MQPTGADSEGQASNKRLKQGLYLQSTAAQVSLRSHTADAHRKTTALYSDQVLVLQHLIDMQKRDYAQKPAGQQAAGPAAASAGAGGVLSKAAAAGTAAAGVLRAGVPNPTGYRRSGELFIGDQQRECQQHHKHGCC